MKQILRLTVLIALVASLACAGTASAYSLSLGTPIIIGTNVSVDVNLNALSTEGLYAGSFDLWFNSNVLTYNSPGWSSDILSLPDLVLDASLPGVDPVPPIGFTIMNFSDPINNPTLLFGSPLLLATVGFDITGAYSDPSEFGLSPNNPNNVDFYAVTVNNVPEPSTLLLLGAGLSCLFAARRRVAGQSLSGEGL